MAALDEIRVKAALYRIEAGMLQLPDDAMVLARAYRALEVAAQHAHEADAHTCPRCGGVLMPARHCSRCLFIGVGVA